MIYTSYFSSKKYNKEDGISISRYNKFWEGESYPLLYPSASLLAWWKDLTKKQQHNIWLRDQYEQAYFYYRYMCMQMDYKIKCKEYEKMCNTPSNSEKTQRRVE